MVPIDFYEEQQEDGSTIPVVSQEFEALFANASQEIRDCAADLLAALSEFGDCRTCKEAGLAADVTLTGDPDLYHYIDVMHSKTAMLFSVSNDAEGAISQITVVQVCKTASTFIPARTLATARKRLASLKRST